MTIPSQKKQVEEMAKELGDVTVFFEDQKFTISLSRAIDIGSRKFLLVLAKHVLGLIIQAQIISLEFTKLKSSTLLIDEVIAGLKKDLQSLNPPKER